MPADTINPLDEGREEKQQPEEGQNDKDIPTEDIAAKVRSVLDAESPLMEITISVDEKYPLILHLPAAVIKFTHVHRPEEIANPAATLTGALRAWMDGTCDEDEETCFSKYLDPTLYYWAQEHFSDENLTLSDEEREELAHHMINFTESFNEYVVTTLMSTKNKDLMEFCWYSLIRLLALEHKLTIENGETSTAKATHLSMIQDHRKLLLQQMNHYKHLGWLNVESAKASLEGKLIPLAQSQQHLRPYIAPMLSDEGWTELVEEGQQIRQANMEHWWENNRKDSEDFGSLSDDHILNFLRGHEQERALMEQLRHVFHAMNPEREDDPAWDHPMEYLEHLSKDAQAIFLHSITGNSPNGELTNGEKFDLDFAQQMTQYGHRNWLFTHPEHTLVTLTDWLKQNNDHRSVTTMQNLFQEYMLLKRGNRIPSLRDFLALPNMTEPAEVTHCLRYWQEIWDRKEAANADVRLFHCMLDNELADAMQHIASLKGQRFIEFGEMLAVYTFQAGLVAQKDSFHINHRHTREDYPFDYFAAAPAMQFAAHEIGKRRGFGIHQSSAILIKNNPKLLTSLKEILQEEELHISDVGFGNFIPVSGKHGGDLVDAAVYTDQNDDQEQDGELEPSEVDEGAPLVSQR